MENTVATLLSPHAKICMDNPVRWNFVAKNVIKSCKRIFVLHLARASNLENLDILHTYISGNSVMLVSSTFSKMLCNKNTTHINGALHCGCPSNCPLYFSPRRGFPMVLKFSTEINKILESLCCVPLFV